jgi:hypothetical protein
MTLTLLSLLSPWLCNLSLDSFHIVPHRSTSLFQGVGESWEIRQALIWVKQWKKHVRNTVRKVLRQRFQFERHFRLVWIRMNFGEGSSLRTLKDKAQWNDELCWSQLAQGQLSGFCFSGSANCKHVQKESILKSKRRAFWKHSASLQIPLERARLRVFSALPFISTVSSWYPLISEHCYISKSSLSNFSNIFFSFSWSTAGVKQHRQSLDGQVLLDLLHGSSALRFHQT